MSLSLPVYSVSQVNQYIKEKMDGDGVLSALFLRGEISNYKCYPSGHHYFSLKDEEGSIRCVIFRREAVQLRFKPKNGMKVIAFGRITVFPRDGQYQLYCSELASDGVGDLHVAFEQLKEKLHQEGLFDPAHKKQLPRYPKRIALITSPAGAAVRDMLRILKARYPVAEVLVVPVRVQGVEAPGEIARALDLVNACSLADLIITGRGGGAMEDLWAFNEEIVARAIYRSRIPVISAVGHEPDVTIADFVADLRAATPSNGAELAVPDRMELQADLYHLARRMGHAMGQRVAGARTELERLRKSRALTSPRNAIEDRRVLLDHQTARMTLAMEHLLQRGRQAQTRWAASLQALSPLAVLGRGYAIARGMDQQVLRSVNEVFIGEEIQVTLSDGTLACVVKEKGSAVRGRKKADL